MVVFPSPEKAEVARKIKAMLEGYEGISTAWARVNYGQDEMELMLEMTSKKVNSQGSGAK